MEEIDANRNAGERWRACSGAIAQFSALALVLFGIQLWVIGTYGNATPFWDQWDAEAAHLYAPYLQGSLSWTSLLAPHNEHRIMTTRLLALFLLRVNGQWNPLLEMVVNAGLRAFVSCLLIALLTRAIGRRHLFMISMFAFVFFAIPYGWENTLCGFQSQFYFVLLFSAACLWLTGAAAPLSLRWWSGAFSAILAFLSLASGVLVAAVASGLGLLMHFSGLRRNQKQLIAVAIFAGLSILGIWLTPTLEGHAPLKAHSSMEFLRALKRALSWPLPSGILSVAILNSPVWLTVAAMLRKRPPADDRRWFLVAFGALSLAEAMGLAYGRAAEGLASRYMDLLTVNVVLNFACLIAMAGGLHQRRSWARIAVFAWTVSVLAAGLARVQEVARGLEAKRELGNAEEIHTRSYLATGDFGHLKDKPFAHVPYPDPARLASILDLPEIRMILPANISRSPMPDSFTSEPAGAFAPDSVPPGTPARSDVWGSYGAAGNASTGDAVIRFHAVTRNGVIGIPIAGYPLSNGISIDIEQNGRRVPLPLKRDPQQSWDLAYAKVDDGEFAIHLADSNPNAWVAVGGPVPAGRLDAGAGALLENYGTFLACGLALLALLPFVTRGEIGGQPPNSAGTIQITE